MAATTRADDEMVLDWLKDRTSGLSAVTIGRAYGATSQRVSTATNRVMRADLAESGEPVDVVRAGYWA